MISGFFLYQEPRRIPTYMAAIIRRHRFVILAIFCLLIFLITNWHFRRKDKYLLSNTLNENVNDEIQLSQYNKNYFSNMERIPYNTETEQAILKMVRISSKVDKMSPYLPSLTENDQMKFHFEDFRHFIPIELKGEFTTKISQQFDEKFGIGVEGSYPLQHPELELATTSKVVGRTDIKYFRLKNSPDKLQQGNTVSIPGIQTLEKSLRASNQNHDKAKANATFITSTNEKNKLDMLNVKKKNKTNQEPWLTESNFISTDRNPALLIDTPGCKIPRLDPWDPTVKHLIKLQDPYVCPGPPVFMKSNPGGSITLSKTILETYYNITPEELSCYYQPIYRMHNESSNKENTIMFGNASKVEFGVPLDEDYVNIQCKIYDKEYEQYFPIARLKPNVEKERNSIKPRNSNLNVILLGIDSVSKLNFLRHFPRTRKFLNEKLKTFEMNGYTKVEDNTFPNIVPLLTGRFVEHWWNETLQDTMYFDNVSFIWKEYAEKGYRTFFAEDNPFFGIFNYFKRGFYDPPTDYYFRPMALALERWKITSKPKKEFCLNSQTDFDIIYDYLKEFTQTMDTRPYFAFGMLSTITHDELNYAGYADEPTERLLDGLLNTGALNNTLLVLFSDHGIRYGKICQTYIGKFEERLPFMYIYVPQWFLDQYPEIANNLKTNQDRLMTLFDIHATMIHLLDLNKTVRERSRLSFGKSLFEEITPNRTCYDAFIDKHWCPCQLYEPVGINISEALNASQAIVRDINSKLKTYGGVCELLEVEKILDVRVGKVNETMLQYLGTENVVINKRIVLGKEVISLDDYMITLVTKPGGAEFEATVRHNPVNNSYKVLGIGRINMYGNTSWCIDSPKMKIFCYCKIQKLV